MTLTLQIENDQTPGSDSPTRITVPPEGLQAGRGAAMGWVLADASRHISGHHFDIYRDDTGWWLRDVSTNGTFLQGHRNRLDGPHLLTDGDRFQVGQYIIVAVIADARQPDRRKPDDSLPDRPLRYDDDAWSLNAPALRPLDPLPARNALADFAPDGPSTAGQRRETTGISAPFDTGPSHDFVTAFCNGAGLPPDLFGEVDASQLAHTLGQAVRQVSTHVMMALQDRAAARQFAGSNERTEQGVQDNNPLKFLPDSGQAVEAMFLRPRPGFLIGAAGLDEALADLRLHQAALFAALRPALSRLLADLAPAAIEAEAEITRAGGNRHAKSWEIFSARWSAKGGVEGGDLMDEFLSHFVASYGKLVEDSRRSGGGSSGGD